MRACLTKTQGVPVLLELSTVMPASPSYTSAKMHHHQCEWLDRQRPPYDALHTGEAYAGVRAWMTIWLSVRVPVLSEHSTVMPAISSIAVSRVTIAPCADSCRDPSASVVVLRGRDRHASGVVLGWNGVMPWLYCI